MRVRRTENDAANLVDVENPSEVHAAVRELLELRYPAASFAMLERVFDDVAQLFAGRRHGYLACDTHYHDLRHTLDVTLAIARIVDGWDREHVGADRIGPQRALLGVIVALLHDVGYLRRAEEAHRHGAELTRVHVSRSARFIESYLPALGLADLVPVAMRIVHFTGFEQSTDQIELDDPRDRRIGQALGAADLVAQLSDRLYLEKCRDFLYDEFVVAGIARPVDAARGPVVGFESAIDLLRKTPAFVDDVAMVRLDREFGGIHDTVRAQFGGANPYVDEIALNVSHLERVIAEDRWDLLRRSPRSLVGNPPAAAEAAV